MLSRGNGREVEAVDGVTEHAVLLVFEVNHAPHLGVVPGDGEYGFPCSTCSTT